MSNIDTISEFLLHAGTDYRIFDMARGIRALDSQTFLEIENSTVPVPFPRQQHAWFGVLFFNKQASKEQYIWFVKLPIDEQGLVIAAGRRQFLQIVIEALGQQLDNKNNPNNQLPENPFTFIPNQSQLADFNSICRRSLNLSPSEHFEKVKSYLVSPKKQDWQSVSVQGIADFCATIKTAENTQLFLAQFTSLVPEMQTALCSSLENHQVDRPISSHLIGWSQTEPKDLQKLSSTLRALCQALDKKTIQAFILSVLNSDQGKEPNVLMLIAARHWQCLNHEKILKQYINLLADTDENTFVGLYSDLVQIPEIRHSMLGVLRWPEKSPQLTRSIGQLFGQSN
jgi:hypothetical protein